MSRPVLTLKPSIPATMTSDDLKAAASESAAASKAIAAASPAPQTTGQTVRKSPAGLEIAAVYEDAATLLGKDVAKLFFNDGEATATKDLKDLTAFRAMVEPYCANYAKFLAVQRMWAAGYAGVMAVAIDSGRRTFLRRMDACALKAPISTSPEAIAKANQRAVNKAAAAKQNAANKAILAKINGGDGSLLAAAEQGSKGLPPVPPSRGGEAAKLVAVKLTSIEAHLIGLFRKGDYAGMLEIIGGEQARDASLSATAKAAVSSAKVTRAPKPETEKPTAKASAK